MRGVTLTLLALLTLVEGLAATAKYEMIARSGDFAPDGLASERYATDPSAGAIFSPEQVVINSRGQIAFLTTVVTNPAISGNVVEALFFQDARGVHRLTQSGGPPPGLQEPVMSRLSDVALNDDGEVVLVNRGFSPQSLVSSTFGHWQRVLSVGDTIPNHGAVSLLREPDANFPIRVQVRFRGAAEMLIPMSTLHPEVGGPALWLLSSGGLLGSYWSEPTRLFRYDALNLVSPGQLMQLTRASLGSAPAQRSAFLGSLLRIINGLPEVEWVLWERRDQGEVREVISMHSPVPGMPRYRFASVDHVSVNGAGQIGFSALVYAPENPGRVSGVVCLLDGDRLRVVVTEAMFSAFLGIPADQASFTTEQAVITRDGSIVFSAWGLAGLGLFRWSPTAGLRHLVQTEVPWPGVPVDWWIGGLSRWNATSDGRVAFVGGTRRANPAGSGQGLWITDTNDVPVLVAQVDMPDPSPGSGILALKSVTENASIEVNLAAGPSGGEDGIPRFLSETHEVVFAVDVGDGRRALYRAWLAGDRVENRDDSFEVTPVVSTPFSAPLHPTDTTQASVTVGTLLFRDAVISARPDKDWTGGRLRLESVSPSDAPSDRLGVDARSLEREGIELSALESKVLYRGVVVGTLAGSNRQRFEVHLESTATTDAIRHLVRSLAHGMEQSLESALVDDPRTAWTNRLVRLELVDGAGRRRELHRTVEFPRTVGIDFEGAYGDRWFSSALSASTDYSLRLELVLSDGTHLPLGCRSKATAAAIQWTPNSMFGNFRVVTDENGPCAMATFTLVSEGGFPCIARLHEWQRMLIIDRQKPISDIPPMVMGCVVEAFRLLFNRFPGARAANGDRDRPWTHRAAGLQDVGLGDVDAIEAGDLTTQAHGLREWMRGSKEGRRLIDRYAQFSPEISLLAFSDPVLLNEIVAMIRRFSPGLSLYLAGRGSEVVIRRDMVDSVNRVFDRLASNGGASLQATIEVERARFRGLRDFEGRTFAEWGGMLGLGVPRQSIVIASKPRWTASGFQLEVNRVPGHSISLWRRSDLDGTDWEQVHDVVTVQGGFSIQLTDPGLSQGARVYQVRAAKESGASQFLKPEGE